MFFNTYAHSESHATTHSQQTDGLVQVCGISIANTLEILQACNNPLIHAHTVVYSTWINDADLLPGTFQTIYSEL